MNVFPLFAIREAVNLHYAATGDMEYCDYQAAVPLAREF